MANDGQGFFDRLVEDICSALMIKGAVEASRDENGKADPWKAAGMAMGLGLTSDGEVAALAGFLGAEGAFDADPAPEEETEAEETEEETEVYKDTWIGINLVDAEDMKLLAEAGYDEIDLDLMESDELEEAMEDAGVDTFLYDFDD